MQGNDGRIPKSVKRKLDESNIIGELVAGITTRRNARLESHQELFFNEVRVAEPGLAEFCRQNKVLLGLQDLHNFHPEEVKSQARSFMEGYHGALEMHNEVRELREKLSQADERLKKVSEKEKEALIADLAKVAKSASVMAQVNAGIEKMTGLDISKGLGHLMKGLASKIGPKGGSEDPTKTATDLEALAKIKGVKSISMPITLAKGIIVAIVAPSGIPFVGAGLTMLPIVTMVWPALVAWDVLNLPSNIMGSPFATGNLNNLVKECEAGFSSGPKIAENMPGCSGKTSKGRTPF